MKTSTQKRLGLLSALFVLSLLVIAVAVQVARADPLVRTGPGSPIVAPVLAHQGGATSTTPLAGTQGRGGVSPLVTTPSSVRPAASSTPSTTVWIVVASVAAVLLLLIEWALLRRRSSEVTAETFCEQRPDSALCRVG
jgi:hypothetical protein